MQINPTLFAGRPHEVESGNGGKVTKPSRQPDVESGDDSTQVGWVQVLKLTEPPLTYGYSGPEESREESPEESLTENPAETQLNSEDWLFPSPDSGLPESGEVWVNGEDNDQVVELADVTSIDPSFEAKRKHILAACLRGESDFDYDGLSPLGVHCLKQLVIWLQTSDRKQWNLFGMDMQGMDLTGANLQGVKMANAKLAKVKMRGVNLEGASLEGVDLEGADLEGANLEGAKLAAWDTNLKGVNLAGANLLGVELKRMDLEGASLAGANLAGTDLGNTRLAGVNLQGANLQGAWLTASLKDVKLEQANLEGATVLASEARELSADHQTQINIHA
jgi:uncharacterized protein YjbI with pentapeptide repeats